jgi:HPr kinase/phosphorylase
MLVHATTIAMSGMGVMFIGPPGGGKSQLSLRLIHRGAWLVADDQTALMLKNGAVVTACPATIRGLLEIRGLGIVKAPAAEGAVLKLVVDLDPIARAAASDPRMPFAATWKAPDFGPPGCNPIHIPCVQIDAFRPDAAEAVIAALAQSRDWEDSPAP